ncbi:MAG: hypothetical protein HY901_18825 [Deltaproteobacteria bacterium]|nr:hypothetical protein [Deltaproteobacteria bacterium]
MRTTTGVSSPFSTTRSRASTSSDGCEATTSLSFEQGDGRCTSHDGCDAPVVLCAIEGGGHSWPGGQPKPGAVDCPADGPQSTTFDASEAAWQFFRANPRP